MRGKCLKFTLQVLTIANSMPPMRKLRRQVNNLDSAIQSQEYSKACANLEGTELWHECCMVQVPCQGRHCKIHAKLWLPAKG